MSKFLNLVIQPYNVENIFVTLVFAAMLLAMISAGMLGASPAMAWIPLLALSMVLTIIIGFSAVIKSVRAHIQ